MKRIGFLFALSLFAGQLPAQQQYCVENDITHAYLNDFTYDTVSLDKSFVMKYFNMPHDYRLDAPRPVELTWTHQDGAESQTVEVSESADFTNAIVFALDKDTARYELYNLAPGRKYYYRILSVKSGTQTTVGSGQLEPTGMLRWVYAQGTWNVRDMGGWTGLNGYRIKYGKIFRGAQLIAPKSPFQVLVTDQGIEALRNVGIRAELDLRSSSQAPSSVSAIAKPTSDGGYDVDFKNISESVNARMLNFDRNDANIRELQWVIDELKAGKPVFYHCQNGADRTGTLGFLIGALLGMGESDLAKDYELTTFCEVAAAAFDPTEKGFARLRNYEGKKGSPLSGGDNADEYKFAKLVEKMRSVSPQDGTYQQKIYNFFKNGVNGTKISESDLQWFINYMLGPLQVNSDTKISIEKGETSQIDARIVNYRPGLPNPVITYQTSDPAVATVSETGLITAVRGGTAQITVQVDGFTEIITVNVEKVESELPAGIVYGDNGYVIKGKNIVKNGSFEYADGLSEWKDGAGAEVSADNFSLQTYPDSEDRYLESKADGDETSVNSISMSWRISARKTYVFGYKVKNSTDIQTNNNQNLKILLYKSSGTKEVEVYPSYDGNWKEVQYVFTNSDSYTKLQIHFSHLSQNGNNTCLDNFYLAEVEVSTDVDQIRLDPTDGAVYDLNGRKVGGVVDGIIIRDGKKYLVR